MKHAWLRSVPAMLIEAASAINDDDLLPLRVPASTFAFLYRLGKQCDHSTKPLARFLLRVHRSQLVEEIIRGLLPAEHSSALGALRAELEPLQREKEEAVANQDWEHARAVRDKTEPLKDRIRQKCKEAFIPVQPDDRLQAISRLGFDQPIIV